MDVHGKTKENVKSIMDIAYICDREELHSQPGHSGKTVKPKEKFILAMDRRRELSKWAERLNMSYGYCSNLRNIVDLNDAKINHMKSHDCHVFIETLQPIAFNALPNDVLKLLIEISKFFKNLCSITLLEEVLKEIHRNIAINLRKLDTIFLPGFFNVIGQLPVYLA